MDTVKPQRKHRYKYLKKAQLRPIQKMCGYWKSNFNSPPIRIFRTTQCYCITVYYEFDASITTKIRNVGGSYLFDLFGFKELAHDEINDVLLIADEGSYVRNYSATEDEF